MPWHQPPEVPKRLPAWLLRLGKLYGFRFSQLYIPSTRWSMICRQCHVVVNFYDHPRWSPGSDKQSYIDCIAADRRHHSEGCF